MNIKKFLPKPKSPYKDNAPRVRNSYYTFSKEYPAGNIPLQRRMHLRFKSKYTKKWLYALLTLAVICISFFGTKLMLDISYKAPVTDDSSQIQTEPTLSPLEDGGFRALYMPYERLGDTFYIRSFIKKIEKKNCNAVVIDFKTESGKLCYSSLNLHAINAKCAIFDNNTVREAISIFRKEGITVAARVFCFLDNTIPRQSPSLAVKYMNTDVNWIDAAMGSEGKTWLNPCSKSAQKYLLEIIKELNSFNIDGFILEKCHYPEGGNLESATFPGVKNFKSKNEAIISFIAYVKKILDDDDFLIITKSATNAAENDNELYSGDINKAPFDAVAPYTMDRPEGIVLDKKTDYADIFRLFSSIEQNHKGKTFVPVIDFEEYTRRYLRAVRKSYENYILFDPSGKY